jgi:hypothetical protein
MAHMLLRLVPLLLAAACAFGEESLDQQVAATDFSSADSVFALANWCKDHRLPTAATKYYNQVLKVDKDHDGARAALGFVRVGDRWVPKAFAPESAQHPAAAAGGEPEVRRPTVPGPTAAQMTWDYTAIPADPEPNNPFITKYIERLPKVANDSNEMDVSVATCIDPKNWGSALPRLCKALLRDDFTDLYGASFMVLELGRKGRLAEGKPLLPFLVKASTRVSDPDDLAAFASACGALKDRRAVPRLIELMEQGGGDVANTAGASVAQIASLPASSMTAAKAHEWWDLNHNVSEHESERGQLRSNDPATQLEAAKALFPSHDTTIVPVLIKLLRSDDLRIRREAITVLAKITGDDWGFSADGDPSSRTKIADRLDKWWKEEGARFHWPEDAKSPQPASTDPCAEWVTALDSTEGNKAQESEARLRERGEAAIPALIDGLSTTSSIVRRKCNDLLRESTKQDFQFDPRGPDEQRAKAVAAWKEWWQAHKPAGAPAPAPAAPVPESKPRPPQHDVP